MSAPAMPARIDTREAAVEAVIRQVDHAQEGARRVDRHLTARNTAERIVDGLGALFTGTPGPPLVAVPDALATRLERFLEHLIASDAAYAHLTRGSALDALEAPSHLAAALLVHPDLFECSEDDQAETLTAVRAARVLCGASDTPHDRAVDAVTTRKLSAGYLTPVDVVTAIEAAGLAIVEQPAAS